MTVNTPELRESLAAAGQAHALEFLDRLRGESAERLARELRSLDLTLLEELRALVGRPPFRDRPPRFEPPELFPLRRSAAELERAAEATERGSALLRAGQVAYVVVAGGQASRLGFDGPKGTFPIGPVSGRTLFEIHARRLDAARARYGAPVRWYVMTSPATDADTRTYFEAQGFLGLGADEVFFFRQDVLPALDDEGRLLFSSPDRLFLAPDGHGGILGALERSGALADMRSRGIEELSYFQVDNPLVRPADPLFLGLHAGSGAQMSSKVVEKTDPDEKVGVLGRIDGRLGCIEYSDLPPELREAREADGRLRFRAGNIAVHALNRSFVESLTGGAARLPWHVARKRMRVVDPAGKPREVDGNKFEAFVFDALGLAGSTVTLEVERAAEFSPVKNKSGADSPQTARRDLCRLHAGWVRAAGAPLPDADGDAAADGARADAVEPSVEVDPLCAETLEEFLERSPLRPRIDGNRHLYEHPG